MCLSASSSNYKIVILLPYTIVRPLIMQPMTIIVIYIALPLY